MASQEKFEKIGMVSSSSVQKHTKKNWDQWVEILDLEGARQLEHKDIAALLKKKFKLSPWWQQGVALGYAVAIGRRVPGQNQKGEFTITATKNLSVDSKKIWKFLNQRTDLWLRPLSDFKIKPGNTFETDGGIFGEVRTMKVERRIRMTWQDSDWPKLSIVQITIVSKPKGKCILVIQHEKLLNQRFRNQMREHWKQILQSISEEILSHP